MAGSEICGSLSGPERPMGNEKYQLAGMKWRRGGGSYKNAIILMRMEERPCALKYGRQALQ